MERAEAVWVKRLMKRIFALLFSFASSAALAQTTGATDPTAPKPTMSEDVPPGGCMPIGVTAAGEMVFPLACREFLERIRGETAGEPSSVGVVTKPDNIEEKPLATKRENVAPAKRAQSVKSRPVEEVLKRTNSKSRARRGRIPILPEDL
jgi:hypothetical protein